MSVVSDLGGGTQVGERSTRLAGRVLRALDRAIGWLATFASTAISLELRIGGVGVDEHLSLVAALALVAFVVVLALLYLAPAERRQATGSALTILIVGRLFAAPGTSAGCAVRYCTSGRCSRTVRALSTTTAATRRVSLAVSERRDRRRPTTSRTPSGMPSSSTGNRVVQRPSCRWSAPARGSSA